MITWLRNHISYSRSAYGNRHLRLTLAGRFLYVAWGTNEVSGELEK